MIKIKCLSEEKLNDLKRIWSGEITPLVCARVSDTYSTNYDVQIAEEALFMHSKNEATIYYRGLLLRFSDLDFVSIEIV